ncbi:MAG: 5-(carboxyamino)imidazole ribonucleotide synthase [Nitratireductor sp.]
MTVAARSLPVQLEPGSMIGILGGGQLARMLAMAAARLGYRTCVYDPDPASPAAQLCSSHYCCSYDDTAELEKFAALCDVVTYEFENVPVATATAIASISPVFPSPSALEASQDRLVEKTFISGLGIGTAPCFDINGADEIAEALAACGGSGILKTRRMGYDGKGQMRLNTGDDLEAAWQSVGRSPSILEGLVSFDCEISVIGARSGSGEFRAFEPARNEHRNGILHASTVPSGCPAPTIEAATEITSTIMDALDYVGVLGVEFFVLKDGSLLVNEIAPRVHNSGHWTEAACTISQFEQHVRAISGLPLGNPERHDNCRMENLIGHDIDRVPQLLADGNCMIHLYGKAEARPGRKMGHVTWLTKPAQG